MTSFQVKRLIISFDGFIRIIISCYAFCKMNSQEKHYFYCVSDLNNSTIHPRPLVHFYEAKEISEKENSSLITSLEPNFDFQREILLDTFAKVHEMRLLVDLYLF